MIGGDEIDDVRITGGLLAGVLAICLARLIGVVAQDEREHWRAAELAREDYRLNIMRTWSEQARLQVEIAKAIYCDPPADCPSKSVDPTERKSVSATFGSNMLEFARLAGQQLLLEWPPTQYRSESREPA